VEAGDRGVSISGIVLRGLGAPVRASFATSGEGVSLRVQAPRLDVSSVALLVGQMPRASGDASLDMDLHPTPRGLAGRARATYQQPARLPSHERRGSLELSLLDRALTGRAEGAFDGARFSASLNGRLGGAPARVGSWTGLTGKLSMDSTVPLPSIAAWVPRPDRSWDLQGVLTAHADVTREAPDGLPRASVEMSTRDTVLGSPARLTGVDAALRMALDGPSGAVHVEGDLHDRAGVLVRFEGDTRVPARRLVKARLLREDLEHTTAEVKLEMPARSLSTLPPIAVPGLLKGLHGELGAVVTATGSLVEPRVELHATGHGLHPASDLGAEGFDGTLEGAYDGNAVTARMTVSHAQKDQLDALATVDLPIASVLEGRPEWEANVDVGLHRFPLEEVPAIAKHRVLGVATGDLALHGLHRDARVEATLHLDRPRLGRTCFDGGDATLHYDGATLSGSASLGSPSSSARVTLEAPATWGAALFPSFEPGKPVQATLAASRFHAGALMPLVWGPVNRLDGLIDADARAVFMPDLQSGTWTGEVRLSKGTLEVPILGERFEDLGGKVTVGPWGTVHLDDVVASNGGGRVTATAQATFAGPRLRTASADISVPRDKRFPLVVAGVPVGQVSGSLHADGTMNADGRTLDTTVVAKKVEVDLPEASGHSLQPLPPSPDIRVGAITPGGRFVLVANGPPQPAAPTTTLLALHAAVDLGELQIRRGLSLDITVKGQPVVDLAEKTRMHGVVELTRGRVEVFGKRFTLEPSTLAFTGDPDHPQLHVTAKFESPDKTNVFADVTGTLGDIKLKLRSEPPLSQDEIVSLLLFGTESGGFGQAPVPGATPDIAQRAAGVAGGVLTQGLNEALSGITTLQIATRVDTSQATNPRPMVEVRLSNNVVTRVTVQTGLPAPGEPRDLTLVSFDWHFHPSWSLQTTVGDAGSTAIEVLWRHRY
jgi:translocation and assembly module TamB